jgi:hypothetical protein
MRGLEMELEYEGYMVTGRKGLDKALASSWDVLLESCFRN